MQTLRSRTMYSGREGEGDGFLNGMNIMSLFELRGATRAGEPFDGLDMPDLAQMAGGQPEGNATSAGGCQDMFWEGARFGLALADEREAP